MGINLMVYVKNFILSFSQSALWTYTYEKKNENA